MGVLGEVRGGIGQALEPVQPYAAAAAPWVLPAIPVMMLLAFGAWVVYTLNFAPLAKFPGPRWAAISPIYYTRMAMSGKLPMRVRELHRQYGDVVRISPAELSFATPEAYRDIYTPTGADTFVKSAFYKVPNFTSSDIIGEADVGVHAAMRKLWAHGFSAKALISHEELEQGYVDMLVQQMRKYGSGTTGANVVDWFNYMTFDIIGELVFGEPFGALKSGTPHFWIGVILDNMAAGLVVDLVRRLHLGIGFKWLMSKLPGESIRAMNRHTDITRDMARRRLARPKEDKRVDFLGYMLAEGRENVITNEDVAAQGQNLVIAGSETTATTLSAVMYYLLKNPDVYQRFVAEIRNEFNSYDEISSSKVGRLEYFHAVINETMRLYPPVPFGPPRLSPGAVVDRWYIPKGTEVSVNPWTITRDPRYFSNPDDFVPTRWLDEKSTDNRAAFQPFHLGPRVCLGRNLAFIELRLVLAKLFYTFDATLVNSNVNIERDSNMYILWNKPEIRVQFTDRTQ